jgi:hypothetical protein
VKPAFRSFTHNLFPEYGGDGSEGFVMTGMATETTCASVSAAGDINHDGIGDLLIGAPGFGFRAGIFRAQWRSCTAELGEWR